MMVTTKLTTKLTYSRLAWRPRNQQRQWRWAWGCGWHSRSCHQLPWSSWCSLQCCKRCLENRRKHVSILTALNSRDTPQPDPLQVIVQWRVRLTRPSEVRKKGVRGGGAYTWSIPCGTLYQGLSHSPRGRQSCCMRRTLRKPFVY